MGWFYQDDSRFDSVYFKARLCARHQAHDERTRTRAISSSGSVRNRGTRWSPNAPRTEALLRCFVVDHAHPRSTAGVRPSVPDEAKDMCFERWLPWLLEGVGPSPLFALVTERDREPLGGRSDGLPRASTKPSRRSTGPSNVEVASTLSLTLAGERTSAGSRDFCAEEARRVVAEHFGAGEGAVPLQLRVTPPYKAIGTTTSQSHAAQPERAWHGVLRVGHSRVSTARPRRLEHRSGLFKLWR